jgi:hypothetical protein
LFRRPPRADWIGEDAGPELRGGEVPARKVRDMPVDEPPSPQPELTVVRGRPAHDPIFTGNRELTRRLPAVDLLGVDTDAAALRAGLKQMFG